MNSLVTSRDRVIQSISVYCASLLVKYKMHIMLGASNKLVFLICGHYCIRINRIKDFLDSNLQ